MRGELSLKNKFFMDLRKKIGQVGEDLAVQHLKSQKYKILLKNYRKPWGEVDIIAEKEGVVVFVEVKTNSRISAFSPENRVNRQKLRHIFRTADLFLKKHFPGKEKPWQIDVIAITLDQTQNTANLQHFKNIVI